MAPVGFLAGVCWSDSACYDAGNCLQLDHLGFLILPLEAHFWSSSENLSRVYVDRQSSGYDMGTPRPQCDEFKNADENIDSLVNSCIRKRNNIGISSGILPCPTRCLSYRKVGIVQTKES